MMMLLMDDSSSSSSSSSSSMKDLLPLMMMSGGMGGAPGQAGAMNPMLMLALMDDSSSCTVKNAVVNALTLTADEKKSLANGSKCYDATTKKVIACATSPIGNFDNTTMAPD